MTARPPTEQSEARHAGLDTRHEDQDRTLRALQLLERATGSAAGHPSQWHEHALAALVELDEATTDEQHNANQPDSLLSDILRTRPRLRARVHGVRAQYTQIREVISSLRREMSTSHADALDITDLRRRTERLASALRYQRSRESDLIYEAYYDTFSTDLESDPTTSI